MERCPVCNNRLREVTSINIEKNGERVVTVYYCISCMLEIDHDGSLRNPMK